MKWLNDVSLDTFSNDTAKHYNDYKAAYRLAKAARDTFEAAARGEMGDAYDVDPDCIAFNYRFGKLSLGMGDARPTRTAKPKQSLGDWLAAQ
jgi:hypothetical protein